MDDIIYDRQKDIKLKLPSRVLVAGCGGIGFWAGMFIAMSGVNHLLLFDPDTVDVTNLNRLPVPMGVVGQPKVEVLKDIISSIRPDSTVTTFNELLDPEMIPLLKPNLVVDCSDDLKFQSALYEMCSKQGISYIKAGYDGTHITIAREVKNIWQTEEGNGYRVTPSWVVPAVTVAALVTLAVSGLPAVANLELAGDLKDIGLFPGGKGKKVATKRRVTKKVNVPIGTRG